ncbi:MAG TPA: hypothetical protein VFS21_19675 [Roseiflexaceae bacterium]|nr:hypothetical protein [Roseiflexaceae bacterium]
MLRRCLLLLAALLCCSAPAAYAQTAPNHQVFLPAVRDPGRFIVFSTDPLRVGDVRMVIQRVGGGGVREFKPAVGRRFVSSPDWSPDGKLIAFLANDWDQPYELYVAAPDGSQVRLLTRLPNIHTSLSEPLWSPDSSRIALVQNDGSDGSKYSLFVINADGTGLRRLTTSPGTDRDVSWSPDGRQIVFSRMDNTTFVRKLIVLDMETGAEQELVTGDKDPRSPAWSPDGATIAYTTGLRALMLIGPDGSGRRPLFEAGGDASVGVNTVHAWSPDGRQVVARMLRGQEIRFELFPVGGGEPVPVEAALLPSNTEIVDTFSWGPQNLP